MIGMAKLEIFLGGVLFGTAGVKVLSSKDAKKVYTHVTAAALRAKESVMTTVDTIKENCGDILADAKEINETRSGCEAVCGGDGSCGCGTEICRGGESADEEKADK